MGLSNGQQAALSIFSAACISVAAVSVPAGAPWPVALSLGIVGAIGFGVKEAMGSNPPAKSS